MKEPPTNQPMPLILILTRRVVGSNPIWGSDFSVSSYGWFFTSPFISFIKKTIGKFKTSQQRNNNKTTGLDWGRDFSLKSRIMRYHLLFWARSFTLQASRIPCLPSAFASELLAINRSHLLPAFVVERTLNSISRHQCETLSFRN